MSTPGVSQTYFKTVMLGLDDFGAAVLLNRNNLSISAACGMVRAKTDSELQLHGWQRALLRGIGAGLEFFWPGHCLKAMTNDELRGKGAAAMIQRALTNDMGK